MGIERSFKLDTPQARSLLLSIGLTGFIFVVELVGGFMTNSLALLSDAMHVLADLVALGLALLAIVLAGFPATDTRTYGWHRTEVFAALINGITLIVISGFILYEAVVRIMAPEPVKSIGMLVVAAFGLLVNLVVVHKLSGHGDHDLNMRSAFLHVLGDALISVGVIAGGVIMYLTGWFIVDPALSIIFSFVILYGAWKVLYESAHILLEGVPRGVDIKQVVEKMKEVEHVIDVHRMHVWSICSNISALSAHVLIDPEYNGDRRKIINGLNCILVSCFHINHTTLQLEKGGCEFEAIVCDITHCEIAKVHQHGHEHDHGHDHEGEHEHAH